MAKKSQAKNPFTGRWRIVWAEQWEDEYLDEEVEAFVEFDARGYGSFQFGYLQGHIDYSGTTRDGQPAVEFSWEGGDAADGTPLTGRGWFVLQDDQLSGMIFIHQGDESSLRAVKAGGPKRKRRR